MPDSGSTHDDGLTKDYTGEFPNQRQTVRWGDLLSCVFPFYSCSTLQYSQGSDPAFSDF